MALGTKLTLHLITLSVKDAPGRANVLLLVGPVIFCHSNASNGGSTFHAISGFLTISRSTSGEYIVGELCLDWPHPPMAH